MARMAPPATASGLTGNFGAGSKILPREVLYQGPMHKRRKLALTYTYIDAILTYPEGTPHKGTYIGMYL